MAVQYHSVVDYLIMHLLLDIEAGSHFPPHLTAEESGAREIQKSQGLARHPSEKRTVWSCGEWSAESGAGLGREAGTRERASASQSGGAQCSCKCLQKASFSRRNRDVP